MHKLFSARVVVSVSILVVALLGVSLAKADVPLSWSWGSQIYVNKVTNVSESDIPLTFFSSGNIDCIAVQDTHCSVNTPYGSIYDSSIWIDGKWRPIADYGNNRANFYAVPISDTSMTASNSPVFGSYIYFTDNTSTSLTPSYVLGIPDVNLGSENRLLDHFQLNHPPDRKLADKTGTSLSADLSSMGFSGNSNWMVVTDPDIATLRVNIKSGEVLPFGRVFTYGNGLNPKPKNAISSDGRYAVVASQDASTFTIYDLSTCDSVPVSISRPVNCQSRELINSGYIPSQIPGYSGIRNIRFLDDDTLSFYASYTEGATTKFAQYTLSASSGPVSKLQYLALGDSYISGEGAYHYQTGTDTETNHCHLSSIAYPNLLGYDLKFDSSRSVACSGAVINDVINQTLSYDGQSDLRIKRADYSESRINEMVGSFSPGYIDQLEFVVHFQPNAITMSIGGNDVGFSSILRHCLYAGNCFSTYEDRVELVRQFNYLLFPRLVDAYQKLKSNDSSNTRIYVIGYPQIVKPGGDCGNNVHLDAQETQFSHQLIDYLDQIIQAAALKAGVRYVDVQHALDGYRLCEAAPGEAAVNGLTLGDNAPISGIGPLGNESFHPNAFGHQLLEQTILQATNRLTQPMPAANPMWTYPAENNLEILNMPHSGRQINRVYFDDNLTTDDVQYYGKTLKIESQGTGLLIKPSTKVNIVLHSDPTDLGEFTTDQFGKLETQVTLSDAVDAGYHSLHIYGIDIANEPIDIYKTIFVTSSQENLSSSDGVNSLQTSASSDVSGTVSSKTNQLDIITEPKATSSPSNISTASISTSTHSNTGHVLSDNIVSNPQKPTFKTAETIRVPAKYYFGSGIGFLALVLIAYAAKSWL